MTYIDNFMSFVIGLIYSYGYLGVILATGLEYTGLPSPPSEVVVPLIGAMAAKGYFNIILVYAVTVLAGILGSLILYYFGYFFGRPVVDFIERKIPKSKKGLHKVNILFEKHSYLAIYLARILPFTRSYISIIAGIEKLNIFNFIIYTGLGIGTWNLVLILIGYFIGGNIKFLGIYVKKYFYILIILAIILISIYTLYRYYKKRRKYEN